LTPGPQKRLESIHRGEGVVPNPFSDFWDFLIGNTDDHNDLGSWKYLFVALFMGLIVASITIAVKNWQEDRSQRTASHLATWFVRVLVGGMWFQGMLLGSFRSRSPAAFDIGSSRWAIARRSHPTASW
jgi:hypothetical protein